MATVHFLLVYDLSKQRLVSQERYDNADQAIAAYSRLEAEHSADEGMEIVLVGADSIETVMRTHGQYFALTRSKEDQSPYLVTSK